MYYVPLWMLAVCLPVSALAIYLGLRDTGIPRGLLYVLTVLLSPVLLLGTAFAAVVASTALSAALEDPAAPEPSAREEPVRAGDTPREPTAPPPRPGPTEPTRPAASPSASPAASPAASPSASASASASAAGR